VRTAPLLFRLVGPWSGIRPRPALTPRSDTIVWAMYGAADGDVVSRIVLPL
jgi:hypothetical protein